MCHPQEIWFPFTIRPLCRKKPTRRTPYVPKQSPCGGELCMPTPADMWLPNKSGKLPVETSANITGVTNVYADGITFCLRVTADRYVAEA